MTIESIAGRRKYRVNPDDHCQVQIQEKHGAQWQDYRRVESWLEASKLVFALASKREEETQELPVTE